MSGKFKNCKAKWKNLINKFQKKVIPIDIKLSEEIIFEPEQEIEILEEVKIEETELICPCCGNKENFHFNYDLDEGTEILCNKCCEMFMIWNK